MFTSELEYYRQRAREERERAATSSNPIVAEVHRALAEKYVALASQPEIRPAEASTLMSASGRTLPLERYQQEWVESEH